MASFYADVFHLTGLLLAVVVIGLDLAALVHPLILNWGYCQILNWNFKS